jgi:hypothetical protein
VFCESAGVGVPQSSTYTSSPESRRRLARLFVVPEPDLAAASAAGPVKRTYDFRDTTSLRELLDHAISVKRPRHVHIHRPELDLTLRRAPAPVAHIGDTA